MDVLQMWTYAVLIVLAIVIAIVIPSVIGAYFGWLLALLAFVLEIGAFLWYVIRFLSDPASYR